MTTDIDKKLEQLRTAFKNGILDKDIYETQLKRLGIDLREPLPGSRSVGVNGDIKNSVIITGDHATVQLDPGVKTDPEQLRRAYLNRLLWETGYLPLEGIDPQAARDITESRMNLGAVYTALLTVHSKQKEDMERWVSGDMRFVKGENVSRTSALEMLNTHRHLVLLGDPGSGKSTFVNFVAWCLAGEALGHKDGNLNLLTCPLPKDDGKDEDKRQPWNHGALLPIRIVLRDFAAKMFVDPKHEASSKDIWDFISSELKSAELVPYLKKEFLEKGGLFMLDGLDEVPEAEDRRIQIRRAVEDIMTGFPNCTVLVTSRIYAYQKQNWRIPGMTETVLAPFSEGQIRRFADRWYAHVADLKRMDKENAQGRAEVLKRAIFGNRRLLELAVRPLLLTLMSSLHAWRGGSLPENRERLYNDTMELLLDSWEGSKLIRDRKGGEKREPGLSELLNTGKEQVRYLLSRLAFEAHSKQKDLKGTADVPETELISGLMGLSDNPEVKPKLLMNYLSQRAGLLLPRGVKIYTFPHRTFQEYLAACYLTDNEYPDQIAELVRNEPERWREAALLAGAKAARGTASGIWLLADSLCYREPEDPEAGTPDIWGALIAGQSLSESGVMKTVTPSNKMKLDRVKRWLIHIVSGDKLPATERVAAGNALSVLGDPRFNPHCRHLPDEELLGFVEIPEGKFLMGTKKEDIPMLKEKFGIPESWLNDEIPQHEVILTHYYISRYPVTKAQFRAFVEDSRYKTDGRWQNYGQDNHPVVMVSWNDATAYCNWLNGKLNDRGFRVRLPTEAEWEKAARGTDGRFFPWGNEAEPERANYSETGIGETSPVGCFPGGASPFGLLDMTGNVWEWCQDWYKEDYYGKSPEKNPAGPDSGSNRVLRGGSWGLDARDCRSAYRSWYSPDARLSGNGFRLAASQVSK